METQSHLPRATHQQMWDLGFQFKVCFYHNPPFWVSLFHWLKVWGRCAEPECTSSLDSQADLGLGLRMGP